MNIYKYRTFAKWAKKEGITDSTLKEAAYEIESGLFEANLGSGLYKKRIARKGQGKRGGYRSLLAFKQNDRAVFILGFPKNDRENVDLLELEGLKKLAHYYLAASTNVISNAMKLGELIEVKK